MNFKNVTTHRRFPKSPNSALPRHMVSAQCQSAHEVASLPDSCVGQTSQAAAYSGSTWDFVEPSNPVRGATGSSLLFPNGPKCSLNPRRNRGICQIARLYCSHSYPCYPAPSVGKGWVTGCRVAAPGVCAVLGMFCLFPTHTVSFSQCRAAAMSSAM